MQFTLVSNFCEHLETFSKFDNFSGPPHVNLPPMQIDVEPYVDPYLAMPDDVKQTNVVEAYKNYYINYKKDFAKWTKRPVPEFMNFETHAGYAS